MKKKEKVHKIEIEQIKSYGTMTDKEWKLEKKRSTEAAMRGIIPMAIILIIGVLVMVNAVNGNIANMFTAKPTDEYLNIKLSESEIKQSFVVTVPTNEMDLTIKVQTDEGADVWRSLGTFHLKFNRLVYFNGKIPSDAFVLYYPPKDWYTQLTGEDVKYDEIHVPVPKQKVGVDPTFFKDKDFPYDKYPYDEIAITTNKVIRVVETNETIYDFFVRVKESNKIFNIKNISVEVG